MFKETGSKLRLIIATTAFGMGADCPDIRRIIHWGIPTTLEEYLQEAGWCGKDGEASMAIAYCGIGGRNVIATVKANVDNDETCRRTILFHKFLLYSESSIEVSGCKCYVCSPICTFILCSFWLF